MGSFTQTKNLKNFSFKLHKRPKGEREKENSYSDLDLIAFKSKVSESFLSSQVSLFALTHKNLIKHKYFTILEKIMYEKRFFCSY